MLRLWWRQSDIGVADACSDACAERRWQPPRARGERRRRGDERDERVFVRAVAAAERVAERAPHHISDAAAERAAVAAADQPTEALAVLAAISASDDRSNQSANAGPDDITDAGSKTGPNDGSANSNTDDSGTDS